MPTIKTYTPKIDEGDELVKVQVWLSLRNKRRVQSAIGDDGVHTFVISTFYQRLAEFIIAHDIQSFDTTKFNLFVEFVRNGTDPRATRSAPNGDESGTAPGVQHKAPATKSKPRSLGQSSPRRIGQQAKQGGE